VLVHDGQTGIAEIAESIWYPIWDSGIGLDHSVRTVSDATKVAREDVKAALGMLDARFIAGDRDLADAFIREMRQAWRADAVHQLGSLREISEGRWATHGELAFLLEGDVKESRGGLRDFLALRGIAYAQVADVPRQEVREAYDRLLDVRGALHNVSGRPTDRLLLHEQDAVAAKLGHADADALMRTVADDARLLAYASDVAWQQVERWSLGRKRRWSPRRPQNVRRPLADGVVEQDGEVVLARDTDPARDPTITLRVAAAAATARLPVAMHTLDRLATRSPDMPDVWPESARRTLITLLGSGPALIPLWEAFDQHGLVPKWFPEWPRIRSLPQRNALHRFTVDRHQVETAAAAAAAKRRVARPDLLLLAALLHDLGKGLPGDHCITGAEVVSRIVQRLGLSDVDGAVVVAAVRHHLLLADLATKRDLDDPMTIRAVADAVSSDPQVLDLLHALTEADAAAAGPAAWSDWKAGLVAELVRRTHILIGEGSPPPVEPPSSDLVALAQVGELAVHVTPDTVSVVAPDARGLLSRSAGVLSLHRLDVLSADASTVDGMAVVVFAARPRFGTPPDSTLLAADLRRALRGELPVGERLAARERSYDRGRALPPEPPRVLWLHDAATEATVMELRAADSGGLLHRVTAALESCGAEIYRARVATLGADVVDAFYLGGDFDDAQRRDDVTRCVVAAASAGGASA
jgi:[protein-PII] uridylyltransferase